MGNVVKTAKKGFEIAKEAWEYVDNKYQIVNIGLPIVKKASQLYKLCQFDNWGAALNRIPVIGHVKACYHLLRGQKSQAWDAFKASTRTTAVMGFGAYTGCAYLAGIAAGVVTDSIITTTESISAREWRPTGIFDSATKLYKGCDSKVGTIIEVVSSVMNVMADGSAGVEGQDLYSTIAKCPTDEMPLKIARHVDTQYQISTKLISAANDKQHHQLLKDSNQNLGGTSTGKTNVNAGGHETESQLIPRNNTSNGNKDDWLGNWLFTFVDELLRELFGLAFLIILLIVCSFFKELFDEIQKDLNPKQKKKN